MKTVLYVSIEPEKRTAESNSSSNVAVRNRQCALLRAELPRLHLMITMAIIKKHVLWRLQYAPTCFIYNNFNL